MLHWIGLASCALVAAILHLVTPSTAFFSGVVAIIYVLLMASAFLFLIISPYALIARVRNGYQQSRARKLVIQHWHAKGQPHHIDAAYRAAAQDGCLHEFQRRMSTLQSGDITIGQLYASLELSRVDAGLKPRVDDRVFALCSSVKA